MEVTRTFNPETQSIDIEKPQPSVVEHVTIQSLIEEIARQHENETIEGDRHTDVMDAIAAKIAFAEESLTWALQQPGAIDPRG